jgi:hypothetical protein
MIWRYDPGLIDHAISAHADYKSQDEDKQNKNTTPRLVIGTSRTVGSAKKFVRKTSGFGGGEFTKTLRKVKTGSFPHEFLCRTNCSACADYQPWCCVFILFVFVL